MPELHVSALANRHPAHQEKRDGRDADHGRDQRRRCRTDLPAGHCPLISRHEFAPPLLDNDLPTWNPRDPLIHVSACRPNAVPPGLGCPKSDRARSRPLLYCGTVPFPGVMTSATPLVLLVEDFDDAREMYAEYLEFNGLRVAGAADAVRGLKMAEDLQPSIILMDAGLPGLSGWD